MFLKNDHCFRPLLIAKKISNKAQQKKDRIEAESSQWDYGLQFRTLSVTSYQIRNLFPASNFYGKGKGAGVGNRQYSTHHELKNSTESLLCEPVCVSICSQRKNVLMRILENPKVIRGRRISPYSPRWSISMLWCLWSAF